MKSKELKNREFNIFGSKWKVKFIDTPPQSVDGSTFMKGYTDGLRNEIYIYTLNAEGKRSSDEELWLTFLHELVHSIFGTGQYIECTNNEALVEWIARCINTLLKQNVI